MFEWLKNDVLISRNGKWELGESEIGEGKNYTVNSGMHLVFVW